MVEWIDATIRPTGWTSDAFVREGAEGETTGRQPSASELMTGWLEEAWLAPGK